MEAQISLLGPTVAWWAEGQGAFGYDTSTGRQLWSSAPDFQAVEEAGGLLYAPSADLQTLSWLDSAGTSHSSPLGSTVPAAQQMNAQKSLRVLGAQGRVVVLAFQTVEEGGGNGPPLDATPCSRPTRGGSPNAERGGLGSPAALPGSRTGPRPEHCGPELVRGHLRPGPVQPKARQWGQVQWPGSETQHVHAIASPPSSTKEA